MGTTALGVDIGGTGIKAAPVDVDAGKLVGERRRILTPHPATPDAVCKVVTELVDDFLWKGPVGIAFPAAVKSGVTLTAANVDKSWVNADASRLFRIATKRPVSVLNDADAAGLAEIHFGAGRKAKGVVILLTFGTGIGGALFCNGILVPNTELGHLKVRGKDAEERASDAVRQARKLTWKRWSKRVNEYLNQLEALFWPDLFIIGGGAVKDASKFFPYLKTHARIVPAAFGNNAGIVGAAMVAGGVVAIAPQTRSQPVR